MEKEDIKRFWNRVTIGQPTECWNWQGTKSRGYGYFSVKGRHMPAHRFSFLITNGYLDKSLDILHSCDNPSCVNPSHLRAGTPKENMDEMRAKGRSRFLKHEQHPCAKLDWGKVNEIRQRHAQGNIGLRELGNAYGVHLSLVSLIVRNKIWRAS